MGKIGKWLCKVLGWHKPRDKKPYYFDGASNHKSCEQTRIKVKTMNNTTDEILKIEIESFNDWLSMRNGIINPIGYELKAINKDGGIYFWLEEICYNILSIQQNKKED